MTTHLRATLALCAALSLAGARVALAAGNPLVEKAESSTAYEPGKGPPGCTVTATGKNLGEKPADLEVTIDGTACVVLGVKPEYCVFRIPPTVALGKHRVKIALKGTGGGYAEFGFEIVKKDPKAEAKLENSFGNNESMMQTVNAALKIAEFKFTTGDAPAAVVEGTTTLPDGFELVVILGFKFPQGSATIERLFETQLVKISKGTFRLRFGPYPGKTLLAGEYFADVDFEMRKQSMAALRRADWPNKLSKQEREAFEEIHAKQYTKCLTDVDKTKQETEHADHYRELASRLATLEVELERAFVGAAKTCYRKGTTFDETEYEKWAQGYVKYGDTKAFKADMRYLTRGFQLEPEKWQPFAEGLLATVVELEKKHAAQKARYVGSRDPEAESLGDELVQIARAAILHDCAALYAPSKTPLPDSFKAAKDAIGDERKLSRAHFEQEKKKLTDRLPVEAPPPAEPKKKP